CATGSIGVQPISTALCATADPNTFAATPTPTQSRDSGCCSRLEFAVCITRSQPSICKATWMSTASDSIGGTWAINSSGRFWNALFRKPGSSFLEHLVECVPHHGTHFLFRFRSRRKSLWLSRHGLEHITARALGAARIRLDSWSYSSIPADLGAWP